MTSDLSQKGDHRISDLSDERFIELTEEMERAPDEYTSAARAAAGAELANRGGKESLLRRLAEEDSRLRAEERVAELEAVRQSAVAGPTPILLRALLAFGLMIGFYALAIGIALGLLYLPYAEVVYAQRFHFQLVIFAVGGALIILAAIIPRRDHFTAPGPQLMPDKQPSLFEVIREVSSVTKQPLPREVYLLPDVNAWVAHRGGTMGIGGRRVIGIGLPLLCVVSVSQLRAVLAHEFGHFHGGDTRVARWVYATRAALVRTVQSLAEHESVLQMPFVAYARLFLRVSHAVSRHQEFVADRLAAETIGAEALAGGLKKVHGAALAFGPYWSTEVAPVLNAGYRPPFAQGFCDFITSSLGAPAIDAAVQRAIQEPDYDPYDTHPPLAYRLEGLRRFSRYDEESDGRSALSLIREIDGLEHTFLDRATPSRQALRPIRWEAVGNTVYLQLWERTVVRHASLTVVRTIGELGDRAIEAAAAIAAAAPWQGADPPSDEERRRYAAWIIGAALGAALSRAGSSVRTLPGEGVAIVGSGWTIDPFETASQLTSGRLDGAEWRRLCDARAVGGIALWPPEAGVGHQPPPAREPMQTTRLVTPPTPPRQMKATINCWQCKTPLPMSEDARGKNVRCPHCGTKQRLPV